jgi:hypothetical protein
MPRPPLEALYLKDEFHQASYASDTFGVQFNRLRPDTPAGGAAELRYSMPQILSCFLLTKVSW